MTRKTKVPPKTRTWPVRLTGRSRSFQQSDDEADDDVESDLETSLDIAPLVLNPRTNPLSPASAAMRVALPAKDISVVAI